MVYYVAIVSKSASNSRDGSRVINVYELKPTWNNRYKYWSMISSAVEFIETDRVLQQKVEPKHSLIKV